MLAPAGLLFALFYVTPVVAAVVLSFFRWNGLESPTYIGLQNYRHLMFDDDVVLINIRVTLAAAAITLVGTIPPALLLAICLSGRGRLLPLFRWMLFLPVVMPLAATALLWTEIFWPLDDGLANRALRGVGLPPQAWLGDEATAIWALVIVTTWSSIGFHVVIQLSALSAIPTDLREAAQLETAAGWKEFRYVVLPLLRDSLTVSAVLIVTGTFVFFTSLSAIMTRGGPAHSTEVLGLRSFIEAFTSLNYGRASTITVVSMVLSVGLVGSVLYLGLRKRVEY